MTVELFADLIRTLMREEARTLGVPASAFKAYENVFTPDGGIDAEISVAPSLPGSYLPAKPVVAQFKRGPLTNAGARKRSRSILAFAISCGRGTRTDLCSAPTKTAECSLSSKRPS
jgi:hypothetical protein